MKSNKIMITAVLALSLNLISCDDDNNSQTTNQNNGQNIVGPNIEKSKKTSVSSITQYIPSDTPLLMLYTNDPNHPMPKNLVDKMNKVYASMGELFKSYYLKAYKDYSKRANPDDDNSNLDELASKWLNKDGMKKLGFSMQENEFALYAIDLFPVVRMTLAQSHQMKGVLDELLAKVTEKNPATGSKKQLGNQWIYQFGDNEKQVIVGLEGNNLVASIAPTQKIDELIPVLLGKQKPNKNIRQSAQFKETIKKYGYLENSIFWMNIRQIADYFINPSQHKTAMLDMLQIQDNMFSPVCKSEFLQMLDKMPRLVGGNRKLEEHFMDYNMVFEMANGLGDKLSQMVGRLPATDGKESLSYGFSFDISEAKKLALEFATRIQSKPYKCEMLQGFNQQAQTVIAQLNQPLPPFVSNFKGFNIVIDKLDLDLSKTEPNEMIKDIKAKVLLAVDNPEALLGMASMMMPDIQKLGIKKGAQAVNISSLIPVKGSMIPINLDDVFIAIGDQTIGLSLGKDTNKTLPQSVGDNKSINALINFNVKADFYKAMFSNMKGMNKNLTGDTKNVFNMQEFMMKDMIWWESESGQVTFTKNGLEMDLDINY